MWSRFWAQFEGEDFSATKTLAHATLADIEQGCSTHWERNGNGHADRLAKLGMQEHGLNDDMVCSFFGFVQVVKEAGLWAGQHEVWLSENGIRDAGSITEPPLARTAQVRHESPPQEQSVLSSLGQHDVRAAGFVRNDTLEVVLACVSCSPAGEDPQASGQGEGDAA